MSRGPRRGAAGRRATPGLGDTELSTLGLRATGLSTLELATLGLSTPGLSTRSSSTPERSPVAPARSASTRVAEAGRGLSERRSSERGLSERGLSERRPSERGLSERELSGRGPRVCAARRRRPAARALLASCLLAAASTLVAAGPARAYTLHTAVTNACHEEITLEALGRTSPPALEVAAADETPWVRMAEHLGRILEIDPPRDDLEALYRTSLVLGVRDPDLRGSGPADLVDLRWVHLPEQTQADHFLRRSTQDGGEGMREAAREGRERLLALIEASREAYLRDPDATRLVPVDTWVQYYRTVSIEVWEPLFLLGEALHVVQDSFTHTYRSDDLRTVLTVQNYVDAIGRDHDDARDGPRHSNALDDCTREDAREVRDAAVLASAALLEATFAYWRDGDRDAVERFLGEWMSLEPGCEAGTCTSQWVAIAQASETGVTGCAVGRVGAYDRRGWAPLLALVVASRLRRRSAGRAPPRSHRA